MWRREEPILTTPALTFARDLAASLRLHFFALPCLAALAGAASLRTGQPSLRNIAAAVTCGLGWGAGQLINDLLDVETDAINAPDRPIAAGRLPKGPIVLIASALGLVLFVFTISIHPAAWMLAVLSAVLLFGYHFAKRAPMLGNIAHGALMAVAAAIGSASSLPFDEADAWRPVSLLGALAPAARTLVAVSGVAAWYLQSNYEKDRPGDRLGGYRTLAVLISVRASAIVRAIGIVIIVAFCISTRLASSPAAVATISAAGVVGLASTAMPIAKSSDDAALDAYPLSVVASILALLSLASPLLGLAGTAFALVISLALVRSAFRRAKNF